ncbi:MAG: hypothetical protein KGD66_07885 [Candidatus Lokiarchaeota archaeon]|nr:hypothetical protein [Candidatus Lokiarchaeota archaeon]
MQINPVKLPELDEELKRKKEELVIELNDSNIESNEQNKENELIGDLFYESMKSFFDFGVELANNLTNECEKE